MYFIKIIFSIMLSIPMFIFGRILLSRYWIDVREGDAERNKKNVK